MLVTSIFSFSQCFPKPSSLGLEFKSQDCVVNGNVLFSGKGLIIKVVGFLFKMVENSVDNN